MDLKVAVIGLGNMGKFHFREFFQLGCKVTSIMDTDYSSIASIRDDLKKKYNLQNLNSYSDIDILLKEEELDAVTICTPSKSHYELAKKFLSNGINVLCEKPLTENISEAKELFSIAQKNNLVLSENTQWPSVLEFIDYDDKIHSFEMTMEPGLKGELMLKDHLPHTNSMLIKLAGIREPKNIKFLQVSQEKLAINFDYVNEKGNVSVKYFLNYKSERPRNVSFKINELEFRRVIGENYAQKLISNEKEIKLEDPLRMSVKKFLNAINGGQPLTSPEEILTNLSLQKKIILKYKSSL